MAKQNLVEPGRTINDLELVTFLAVPQGTVNKKCLLHCVVCGAERICWLPAFIGGRVSCKACRKIRLYGLGGEELGRRQPYAIATQDSIQILWQEGLTDTNIPLKPGETLFRAINSRLFKRVGSDAAPLILPEPSVDALPVLKDKPSPDDYPYIIIPADYMPYYLGEPVSDDIASQAQSYYDKRVRQKIDGVFSEHSSGMTISWKEDGREYAYLYFMDSHSEILHV